MKKAILSLILQMLYRTMRVLDKRDDSVAEDLSQLPEGACVRIRAGMADDAPQLTVVRENGRLRKGTAKLRAALCSPATSTKPCASSAPSKPPRAICSRGCGTSAF